MIGTYPGGKSGAGVYQRLINLIPRHRILIVPFAGHCGVVRHIRPSEHTIVIDRDAAVCDWWWQWSRTKRGRAVEVHHCDGIEWMRYRLGCTVHRMKALAAGFGVPAADVATDAGFGVPAADVATDADRRDTGSRNRCDRPTHISVAAAADPGRARVTPNPAAEAFVFADPPYVLSQRSHGRMYDFEMTDADHRRLLEVLTQVDASRYRIMVCGYPSELYASLHAWRSIDHRVPTRGGLQDERIWLNYEAPVELHDYRHLGRDRRHRERIRRRQRNWREQLKRMPEDERMAMLKELMGSCAFDS